jgi:hypothetical protein
MSHNVLLTEILTACETDEPLKAVRLRRYMAEKSPKTRGLVFGLFTDDSVWKLAKNIPSPERNGLVVQELTIALSGKGFPSAFSHGQAGCYGNASAPLFRGCAI